MSTLREQIINTAITYGADFVTFGPADRFQNTAALKIFDKTKTVICLGFRVLRGSFRGVEEGTTYYQYTTTGIETIEETVMPMALLKVCGVIEDAGFIGVPQKKNQLIMETTGDTNPEVNHNEIFTGMREPQLDFAESAVLCGAGEKGLSGAVLTEQNGPFQRFGFILTNAEIEPTPIKEKSLCDNCGECVKSCPGNAIDADGTINKWQCAVYYRGANMSKNPFMPSDAYEGFENREAIVTGEAKFDKDSAPKVMDHTYFYPPIKHAYVSSICGRACDRACYIHLENEGKLKNAFKSQFRKRDDWKLSNILK